MKRRRQPKPRPATASDPLEDFRRGCELVLRSTGQRDPRPVLIPEALYKRLEAYFAERRRRTWEGSGILASYLET